MSARFPVSLKISIPLLLLGFATTLSIVSALYNLPRAERAAEEDARKHVVQELSRLQSTLEYLLLKGELAAAQHQVAVAGHNHDIALVAVGDDQQAIIAATRRAWLGLAMQDVLPQFDPAAAAGAVRERRARVVGDATGESLLGYVGVLLAGERGELRPSRVGSLFLSFDLTRSRSEARTLVLQQSAFWAGSVTVLALVLWLAFHYLLTRRTARLVQAAEQFAAGDLSARSNLSGDDELGKLSKVFNAMVIEVAHTQRQLRQDIADRERSAHALRISQASYSAIFDSAQDAIFVHDIETGAIVDANPSACALFGYSLAEFRQIDVAQLSSGEPPYTRQDAMAMIARASAGEQLRIEWHSRNKDGRLRWDELSIKRVTIRGQDRILVMARDITEKKRVAEEVVRQREALYQREKLAALGSLLAGVAHELNNPLSVVVARAVMLEEQGGAATHDAAVKIRSAAERCARIVRTFLAMARQQQPQRGMTAIDDVVAAALDIASYSMRSSGIEVTLDLCRDIPRILADGDQLHQVVLNLIINAQQSLQERPAPRRIEIASRFDAADGMVRLMVSDNGPGVPPSLRARVFEPYFTTKSIGVGTGVGLAVSLGIVEAHGGTLTLECPEAGGATFTILLPVGDAAAVVEPAQSASHGPSDPACSVLVVDDEPDIRDMLADILRSPNRSIVTARSGRQALECLEASWFDVILTDIRMPDLDGPSLHREIERRWPDRAGRIVFVTGDTLNSGPEEFAFNSGRPVLEKPFLPSEVRRIVAEVASAGGRVSPASRSGS